MATYLHFTRKLANGDWDDQLDTMHHAPKNDYGSTMCGLHRNIPPEPAITQNGWTRTNWSISSVNCERCLKAMEKQRNRW